MANERYLNRRSEIGGLLKSAGLDALLLTKRENVRYFSGFTGEDSFLLVGRKWAWLLTDSRFEEQVRRECPDVPAVIRQGRMSQAVTKILAKRRAQKLGLEGYFAPVNLAAALKKAVPGLKVKPLADEVDQFRQCKDASELAAIQRAVKIAQDGFLGLLAGGRKSFVGRTENQVAAELEYRMRNLGAEKASFESIVAAGANAAMPHYRPRGRKIRAGEPVLIDWGAVADGYCSDLTRVVFTGRIPPRIARIYDVVRRAQAAGQAAIRPGVGGDQPDQAARDLITREGYGEKFGHGLGHGLGLEVHELPRLGKLSKEGLREGMVITVEPGIYLPGIGGVRIEDDVLVTPGGCRRLSDLSSAPQAMTLK